MKYKTTKNKSSHPEVTVKKMFFKSIAKFTGKFLSESLWQRCFLVNFVKYLLYRTPPLAAPPITGCTWNWRIDSHFSWNTRSFCKLRSCFNICNNYAIVALSSSKIYFNTTECNLIIFLVEAKQINLNKK